MFNVEGSKCVEAYTINYASMIIFSRKYKVGVDDKDSPSIFLLVVDYRSAFGCAVFFILFHQPCVSAVEIVIIGHNEP